MANNSVAYGRGGAPDVFADDDPLAELARIAGYDERTPLRSVQEQPVRREPAFNLEDELLRELENYDDRRPAPVLEPEPVANVVVAPAQTRAEREVVQAAAPVRVSDPFNDVEFDALDQRDPMSHAHVSEQFGVAPKRPENAPDVGFHPAAAQYTPTPRLPDAQPEPSGLEMDLISELETSLLPVEPVQQSMKATRQPARAYEPAFRMPLANFNPASVPRHEPRVAAQDAVELEISEPTPPAANAASSQSDSSVWEEELARVAAFAMPVQPATRPAPPTELPQVEAFRNEDRAAQARLSADLPPVSSIPPLPDFASVDQDRAHPERTEFRHQEPVFAADSDDFELALDELEFDLSDILEEEAPPAPARPAPAPVAQPQLFAVASEPAPFAKAFEPRADVRPTPATVAAVPAFLTNSRSAAAMGVGAPQQNVTAPLQPYVPPARTAPQPAMGEDLGDGEAFDPALLADTDEMPEAVPDLNVPELPAQEPEHRPVQHTEFDIDLDAELASFLTQANAQQPVQAAQRGRSAPQAAFSIPAEAKAAARPADGLDDFERALEEDFRRSLQTPFPPRAVREDEGEDEAIYLAPRKRVNWLLPASAAGFVAVIGLSGYAFYAGQSSKLTGDGAPVVIAADTDPVKVAPQNPGGKVVPNQDKAVYDRVATGTLDAPKQSSLISSEEQPVDVVQKTLETLPMETDADLEATSTPVGETEDARLLPQQVASAATAQDQLAVMPRKVKTMVVRPDGTLVEQIKEVPAKAGVQAPVTAVKTEKMPAAPALAEPTKTAATSGSTVPPVAAEPTKLSDVNVAKASAVTGSSPVATAPTTTASTAPAKTSAPVPGARPAEQPVKVVAAVSDQGTVRANTPASPVPASAQPAAQAGGAGGYYIQVASLPSEADAQKSYKNLSAKFGGLIAGRGVDIAKADIAGKGTFYRVRIPAGSSKDEAAALCEKLRSAGGTCLISR